MAARRKESADGPEAEETETSPAASDADASGDQPSKSGLAVFLVRDALRHNGVAYADGDLVELSAPAAAPLLALGVVVSS